MKKTGVFLLIIVTATSVYSQKKAITDLGEEVFLHDNGTWSYAEAAAEEPVELSTNPLLFVRNPNSTFLLKSNVVKSGIWLDTKKWSFKKGTNNQSAEYEMQMKDSDLYAMVISEKIEIPLTNLRNIALQNGRTVAPDLHILKEEYRNVNDRKVMLLQMEGTMQGMMIVYYGYYYSDSNGTIQFITYTAKSLQKQYLPACEDLLNGFVAID